MNSNLARLKEEWENGYFSAGVAYLKAQLQAGDSTDQARTLHGLMRIVTSEYSGRTYTIADLNERLGKIDITPILDTSEFSVQVVKISTSEEDEEKKERYLVSSYLSKTESRPTDEFAVNYVNKVDSNEEIEVRGLSRQFTQYQILGEMIGSLPQDHPDPVQRAHIAHIRDIHRFMTGAIGHKRTDRELELLIAPSSGLPHSRSLKVVESYKINITR